MAIYYNKLTNTFWGDSQYSDALLQVMWHITNACRLNCKFCFSKAMRTTETKLTQRQIRETIDRLKQLGVKKVDLSGGEPLLCPNLSFITKCCCDNDITPTITTSGFGTKSNTTWIENNYDLFSRVIISLDGPCYVHNLLRGSEKAFDGFKRFYQRMSEKKCDRLRINTVVSKTVLSYAFEMSEIIKRLSPVEWCCIQPHPINKGEDFDGVSLSEQEFEGFLEQCRMALEGSKISLLARNNGDYSSYWVLYPNQHICHLTNSNEYDEEFDFLHDSITEIKEAVSQHPQSYINLSTPLQQ